MYKYIRCADGGDTGIEVKYLLRTCSTYRAAVDKNGVEGPECPVEEDTETFVQAALFTTHNEEI